MSKADCDANEVLKLQAEVERLRWMLEIRNRMLELLVTAGRVSREAVDKSQAVAASFGMRIDRRGET